MGTRTLLGDVAGVSPAVLAGDVVGSPAIAGAVSLADLADDVAVGVASLVIDLKESPEELGKTRPSSQQL